jgi:general secretion pathway protein K
VALITALVVVAIAAGIAVAIAWQTNLDTRRTSNLVQGDQAMEYALGAEAWAEEILARDGRKSQGVTALNQDWAQQLPPLPVDGGQIQGKIEDLQGRFNINSLAAGQGQNPAQAQQQFARLLQAVGQDPTLASAVAQWFTSAPSGAVDASDDYYSRLQPPYLTGGPGTSMQSVSELLLVKGITPAVYAQIFPYVCALPNQGAAIPININTASGPVLESLNENVTADIASQVIGERGSTPLNGTLPQAFTAAQIPAAGIGYDSSYFLVTVVAQIGSTHVTLYSLLYRNSNNEVAAVRRTLGTL